MEEVEGSIPRRDPMTMRPFAITPCFACNHRHLLGGVVTVEIKGAVLGTDSARNRGFRAPGGLWAWKRSEGFFPVGREFLLTRWGVRTNTFLTVKKCL